MIGAIASFAAGIGISWGCFLITVFIVSFFRGLKRAKQARIEQLERDLRWHKN